MATTIDRLAGLLAMAQRPGTFEEGETALQRLADIGGQQFGVTWRIPVGATVTRLQWNAWTGKPVLAQVPVERELVISELNRVKTPLARTYLRAGVLWFELSDGPVLCGLRAVELV